MKLKEQKKLGILYLVLGAALFLIGLLTDAGEKQTGFPRSAAPLPVVGAAPAAARVPAHPAIRTKRRTMTPR